MNFFEQELRKIIDFCAPLSDVRYTGRVCVGRLSDSVNAKIHFVTTGISDHYTALDVAIINRNEGKIDATLLRFYDILGKKAVENPNFREGISPYFWIYQGKVDWYVYHPTTADYKQIAAVLSDYLEVYQDLDKGREKEQAKPSVLATLRSEKQKPRQERTTSTAGKKSKEPER
jgi:hypothetical protein